jgi:hypothetical protein
VEKAGSFCLFDSIWHCHLFCWSTELLCNLISKVWDSFVVVVYLSHGQKESHELTEGKGEEEKSSGECEKL